MTTARSTLFTSTTYSEKEKQFLDAFRFNFDSAFHQSPAAWIHNYLEHLRSHNMSSDDLYRIYLSRIFFRTWFCQTWRAIETAGDASPIALYGYSRLRIFYSLYILLSSCVEPPTLTEEGVYIHISNDFKALAGPEFRQFVIESKFSISGTALYIPYTTLFDVLFRTFTIFTHTQHSSDGTKKDNF